MGSYEAERLSNIARNRALIDELGLSAPVREETRPPPSKKRRREVKPPAQPVRTSARIASAPPTKYTSPSPPPTTAGPLRYRKGKSTKRSPTAPTTRSPSEEKPLPASDLAALQKAWSSWTPAAPAPTRDIDGTFHFASHPSFQPNKSPREILAEGAFGGTYFRPYRSAALRTTVAEDWRELPASWLEGLDVDRLLTSATYDAEVNKFGVACGQSIEEWERNGWIRHEWDVRGWFQWYCRFFLGRRCADDERQVGRWRNCVGERGRWRRMLLKKYVKEGVRSVVDEGDDAGAGEVSPVVHQTCHHWAFEVRQPVLDEMWEEMGG